MINRSIFFARKPIYSENKKNITLIIGVGGGGRNTIRIMEILAYSMMIGASFCRYMDDYENVVFKKVF